MTDYLLFIDTETSGLPKDWSLPFSDDANWPHAVQVSWIIYDRDRREVKRANHYIKNDGFDISSSAIDIHGLTSDFLNINGISRSDVLVELKVDIETYNPLVIGHFVKLDYYVLSADYYRAGINNPLANAAFFCTMMASGSIRRNVLSRQMHLGELYFYLFGHDLKNQHNALADVEATAKCFFELLNRGEISEKLIDDQNVETDKWRDPEVKPKSGCALPLLMIVLIGFLIIYISYL